MKNNGPDSTYFGDWNRLTNLQKKGVEATRSRKYKSILQMAIEQDEQNTEAEKENEK